MKIKGHESPFWQINIKVREPLFLKHWKFRTTVLEYKDKCLGTIVLEDKNKSF
jgi:hypothetical protein